MNKEELYNKYQDIYERLFVTPARETWDSDSGETRIGSPTKDFAMWLICELEAIKNEKQKDITVGEYNKIARQFNHNVKTIMDQVRQEPTSQEDADAILKDHNKAVAESTDDGTDDLDLDELLNYEDEYTIHPFTILQETPALDEAIKRDQGKQK